MCTCFRTPCNVLASPSSTYTQTVSTLFSSGDPPAYFAYLAFVLMPDQNPEASTSMVLYSPPSTISLQVVKSAPAPKIGPSPESIR